MALLDDTSDLGLKIRVLVESILFTAFVAVKVVPSISAWFVWIFKDFTEVLDLLSSDASPTKVLTHDFEMGQVVEQVELTNASKPNYHDLGSRPMNQVLSHFSQS